MTRRGRGRLHRYIEYARYYTLHTPPETIILILVTISTHAPFAREVP
eukprot:COSAG01_NODE_31723_length_592_cov_1.545639_1_plen_46_part_01